MSGYATETWLSRDAAEAVDRIVAQGDPIDILDGDIGICRFCGAESAAEPDLQDGWCPDCDKPGLCGLPILMGWI